MYDGSMFILKTIKLINFGEVILTFLGETL